MGDKIQMDIVVNTQTVTSGTSALDKLKTTAKETAKEVGGLASANEKLTGATTKAESAASKMQSRVNAAQREIREMANAVGVLNGPLGGISGRLSSLASLFDKVTPQMMGFALSAIAITGALAFLGPKVIAAAQNYEVLQARIQNATAASGDYTGVSNALNEMTKKTGVSLDLQVAGFSRLNLAAQTLGRSHADILTVQKTVEEIGVMSNLSNAKLTEVMNGLARGFTAGTLRGREFTSVLRNLPALADLIAKNMNTTTIRLIEMAKQGKVSAQQGFDAIKMGATQVDAKFKNFPLTIERAKTAMEASFNELAATIDKTFNISGTTAAGFIKLGMFLDTLREHIDEVIATLAGFTIALLALNYQSIYTALVSVATGFKTFAGAIGLTTVAVELENEATAFSFAKMAAAVNLSLQSIAVNSFENIMLAGDAAAAGFIGSLTAVQTGLYAVASADVAATEATVALSASMFGPALNALKAFGAGLLAGTEAMVGFTLAILATPWTYILAGIAATTVAMLNLKKEVQANTSLHVTWGNVVGGTWKTISEDTVRRINKIKDSISGWWEAVKLGQGIMAGLANWSSTQFTSIAASVGAGTKALGGFLNQLEAVQAVSIQMKMLYSEAKSNIANESSRDSRIQFAKTVGYTGDVSNFKDEDAMQKFENDPRVKAALAVMRKNGWSSYQQYIDGFATASLEHGAPLAATVKPKKDSMADKIAKFTFNTNLENQQSSDLLAYHQDHSNLQYERELLRQDAIKKVDEKHFKFKGTADQQAAQRNNLIQKTFQTSINKADDKVAGQANDLQTKIDRTLKLNAAIGSGADNIAKVTRQTTIQAEMDKVLASGKERVIIQKKLEAEYDANLATQLLTNNDADQKSFVLENQMNEAKTKGLGATQNETLAQDAHNRALSEYKGQLQSVIDKHEQAFLSQAKLNAQADLTVDTNKIKLSIAQTNQLNAAVKKSSEAYRLASIDINAYNTAQANGNALTEQQKADLKALLVQQETANHNLQVSTYNTQLNEQAWQSLGQAFSNAFDTGIQGGTSFSDVMKRLALDIANVALKLAEAKAQAYLFGNATTGQQGKVTSWLQGLFGKAGGAASAAGSMGGASASAGAGFSDTAATMGGVDFSAFSTSLAGAAHGKVFGPSGLHAFASGGIVNSPHIFPFANGTGLMGEAGPEAIMPLKRLSNGDLGVQTAGHGGQAGGVSFTSSVVINVESSGHAETDKDNIQVLLKTLPSQIKMITLDTIREQQRPGGQLNNGVNYQ